jgi:hypothetical protein
MYPLFQQDGHGVAHISPDHLAYVCPYGQLMRAIAHCHKGAAKWMTINFTPDLYKATSSKKLDRTRPDHVGPATSIGAFLYFSSKCFVQHDAELFLFMQ